VFSLIAKSSPRPAPLLRRVLIVDADETSAQATAALLALSGRPDVWTVATTAKALKLAAKVDPDLIICELSGEKLDGLALTRSLRRSDHIGRRAPVILTGRDATVGTVLAARDVGAHELLPRPFTARDLARRIDAVLQPREWVEAMDYVGPDRRSFNAATSPDAGRRSGDLATAPHEVRCGQALKIIRSALAAMAADPHQARRAMLAQAEILQAVAGESGDNHLAAASLALRGHLADRPGEPLDRAETEVRAAPLLDYLRREERRAA
jgi:DNA-binding response OmpR family regulator